MRLLVTADLHLNDNPRDSYRHDFVSETLLALLEIHEPDVLIILGDLTDEKDRHGYWLVNQVVNHIHNLAAQCPVLVLKGNHDYTNPDTPFFSFLKRLERVSWVNTPTANITLPGAPSDALKGVLFLPHTNNAKRDWKGISFKGQRLVFAHNTFEGADAGHGRKLSGIPTSIFPTGLQVVSGDIHGPQKLGPVTYVGSPYTINFGDEFEPRLLLIENNKLKSIKAPGPQKRLIECEAGKPIIWKGADICEGDILKFRVAIRPDQMPKWKEFKAQVVQWTERHNVNLHSVQPALQTGPVTKVKSQRKASVKPDDQLLREYAKARTIDELTMKVGLNLLEKA